MIFLDYLKSTTDASASLYKEKIVTSINNFADYLKNGSAFYDDNGTSGAKNSLVLYRTSKYKKMDLSTLFGMILSGKKHIKSISELDNTQNISKDSLKITAVTSSDATVKKFLDDIRIKNFTLKNVFRNVNIDPNFKQGVDGNFFAFFTPKYVKITFTIALKKPTTEKTIFGDIDILFKVNNFYRGITDGVTNDDLVIDLDEYVGNIDFTHFLINDDDAAEIDELSVETTSAVLFYSDTTVGTARIMDAYSFSEITKELGYYTNNREVFDLKMKKFEGTQISKQDFYLYEIIIKTVVKLQTNALRYPERAIVSCKDDCIIKNYNGINILGGFGKDNKKKLNYDLYVERVSGSGEFFKKFADMYTFGINYNFSANVTNNYYRIYSTLSTVVNASYSTLFPSVNPSEITTESFKLKPPVGDLYYEITFDLAGVLDCYYYIDEQSKLVNGVNLWSRPLDIKLESKAKVEYAGLKDTFFNLGSVMYNDEEYLKQLNIFRPFIKYGGSILVDETPKNKAISEIHKYISSDSESTVSINFDHVNGKADQTVKMEERIGFLYPNSYSKVTEDDIEIIVGFDIDMLSVYCFGNWDNATKKRVKLLKQQYLYNFRRAKQICADIMSVIVANVSREFKYTVEGVNAKMNDLYRIAANQYQPEYSTSFANTINETDDESVINSKLDKFMSSLTHRALFINMVENKSMFTTNGSIFNSNIEDKTYYNNFTGETIRVSGYNFFKDRLNLDIEGGDVTGSKMIERMKNYAFTNSPYTLKIAPYFLQDKLNSYIMKQRIDTGGSAENYYFDEPSIQKTMSNFQTKVDSLLRFFAPLKNENYTSKYTGFLVTNFVHSLCDMYAGNVYNMFNLKSTEYGKNPWESTPSGETNWNNIEDNAKYISYRSAMRISIFDANLNVIAIPIDFLRCYFDDNTKIDGYDVIADTINQIGDNTLLVKKEIDNQSRYMGEW